MMDLTETVFLIWCEAEGLPHDPLVTDPEVYGPMQNDEDARKDYSDNSAWTLEDRDDTYGEVWHYTCPGPHYRLWRGREL